MQLTHLVSLLVVLSTTTTTVTAAPSPKRHLAARTTGEINARHPFNPYHAANRFAATAENKKRASNHGRDAKPERKEKRTVKKKRAGCVARSSSSSSSGTFSVTPSATDYYVASASPSSSSWVDPSSTVESVSESASATGLYVQNAAVNTNYSASSSATRTNGHYRHSSSSAAEPTAASSSSAEESEITVSTSTSTPAPAWTSTSTSATAPATTSASSGTNWKTGGHATYYYQNGNAGACGVYHSDSDKIIAINGGGYWSNYESGGVSPYCGKWITIKATDGSGRSTQAMVADVCPTCTGSTNSLDLSVAAFEDLGTLSQGQIDIEWSFNN